ncbi:TBC1 domain family member 10A-like protein [Dinothrombium tinctorium]|uniref:TBC1 domain family member 10A-like protein n=1 Tax=Dinothrombium tinctorium TaxID=1965070 RepID=A0A3S3RJ97_9ACAR|nr:TBC1 domain family member 10A-like protein [Dinothrombium tinctorium]RWS01757.1 TBC1 domain family member 10A-like protein [Dinothrombium tinctorium]RWS01858.1 TBC1 domain family member 10A-like protein [Dinothrombium tinctorium]
MSANNDGFSRSSSCSRTRPSTPTSSTSSVDSSSTRPEVNGAVYSELHKQCDRYGFFVEDNESKTKKDPRDAQLSVDVILNREKKWLHMCNNWDKFMTKKWRKIRDRCRKGIPNSVRGRAWFYLCAGFKQKARHPDLYQLLDSQIGDEKINDEIRKDLNRQFPSHEMFAENNGFGQQDLFHILKAFSIIKPEIGYCQGQAPLASVLLMHMPAEDAFWCLVQICDHYIPGYFSPGLEAIQIHGAMLNGFLKRFHPPIYRLLKKQNIDPVLYMTEWFMCLFSRTLLWPSVLRVWDMFFCEGISVIFKVAIILIGSVLGDSEERKKCSTMYETLHLLRNIPVKYMSEEYLIDKVVTFELSNRELQKEHNLQVMKRKKEKEKRQKEEQKRATKN